MDAFFFDDLDTSLKELAMWAPIEAVVIEGDETTNTGDIINREAAINEITEYGDSNVLYMSVREARRRLENLPSAKKEITLEDVKAYCKPRCLQIVTTHMMLQPQEEKEIKRLRELAARILGKYEEEKKKQLAAVRLASLRGIERDRAKELQARTEREIENLRKEIKGE